MEEALQGGNVAGSVVRVGRTVRKPSGPWTPAVDALLAHLHRMGFTGSPHPLGRDEQDRQILEYVPGELAHGQPPLEADGLHHVGRLIRDLHDASEGFAPPRDPRWGVVIAPDREELICHHDLAPWNLVLSEERWVFIDWDGAGPGSRLWDLAYAVTGFVPLHADGDPAADAPRIRAICDGYRLTKAQRRNLPPLITAHTRAMFDLLREGSRTGRQPWARLYAEGHAGYWGPAADYIDLHQRTWQQALR